MNQCHRDLGKRRLRGVVAGAGTKLALGVFMTLSGGMAATAAGQTTTEASHEVVMQAVPTGTFFYQTPGEFLEKSLPVDAPRVEGEVGPGVRIMSRQVSQAEYMRCVQEAECAPLDRGFRNLDRADLPAVGVSWHDATDYARWLSEKTGQQWRLPIYTEWVRAAAERYREEEALPSDPANPAVRWLAQYDRETDRRQDRVKAAQKFGFFGTNSLGIIDIAGNVWEWTDTCFKSFRDGQPVKENCGIRILAGAHVAAMPDFIRDPRNGACSIGLPPANLGFRLVLQEP